MLSVKDAVVAARRALDRAMDRETPDAELDLEHAYLGVIEAAFAEHPDAAPAEPRAEPSKPVRRPRAAPAGPKPALPPVVAPVARAGRPPREPSPDSVAGLLLAAMRAGPASQWWQTGDLVEAVTKRTGRSLKGAAPSVSLRELVQRGYVERRPHEHHMTASRWHLAPREV